MNGLQALKRTGAIVRISRKIAAAYVLLVFLPTCLLTYLYYERTSGLLEKEVTNSMLQAIRQVEINISYRLSKIGELSDILIMNQDFLQNLAGSPHETVLRQLQEQKKLSQLINSIQSNDEIYRVRLFVNDTKMYASEHVNFFSLEEIEGESWYREVAAKQGGIVWLPTRRQHYLGDDEGKYVLSCARIVKDPDNFHHILGVLVLDVPENLLHGILNQVDFFHSSRSAFILDDGGRAVSYDDKGMIGKPLLPAGELGRIRTSKEGVERTGDGRGGVYDIYESIPAANWKIVAEIPRKAITKGNLTSTSTTALILVTGGLLLFLFAAFAIFATVTESMVRRVRQIASMVKEEGIELLEGQVPLQGGAFLRLEKSVQGMIDTMKHYMEEYYSSKAKEREAELRALQAQINPHFLYNTLETINWMAIRRGAGEISSMLNALAQYFRLSLSRGRDVLTLRDELTLAQAYMNIQMNRFPGCFRFEVDVSDELLPLKIPKITLQPLIENSILHGIREKDGKKGVIRITGELLADRKYMLCVEDDGIGMTAGQLDRLTGADGATGGYGLYNVNERIRLFCGPDCGITLHSVPGKGTRAVIVLCGDPPPQRTAGGRTPA
ncbi:cache domain-containing sensor histidine kinase [Paenibacillus humicola]|uniref:cache domain-containing sensor histidine kinase n=1 Tax=Paenibacillus humicola TaxID=3110540 RepID=UPI00237B3B1B|nr:sensor histidine kinase [Paenibacillus humicola]